MTRRFVALCLALLLPLQFAWGVAAAYCQHEAAPLGSHFGHHVHVHDDRTPAPAGGTFSVHGDCGDCNAASPQAVTDSTVELAALPPAPFAKAAPRAAPRSAPTREPDRPQWPRPA